MDSYTRDTWKCGISEPQWEVKASLVENDWSLLRATTKDLFSTEAPEGQANKHPSSLF